MPKYTVPPEVKRRIVTELAVFKTPVEVREILKEEYELEMTPMDIGHYDASKDYCFTGEKLRELFWSTRKTFIEELADLPIANQAYRMRRLQRLSEKAEKDGDLELAAKLLEQAAKDFGGIFTNVRNVKGDFTHRQMTADEARDTIAKFLGEQKAEGVETKH